MGFDGSQRAESVANRLLLVMSPFRINLHLRQCPLLIRSAVFSEMGMKKVPNWHVFD